VKLEISRRARRGSSIVDELTDELIAASRRSVGAYRSNC
jgi:hypothetical protein